MLYLVERVDTRWTGRIDDSEHHTDIVGVFSQMDMAKQVCSPFREWDGQDKITRSFKITHLDLDKAYEELVEEWVRVL